VDHELVARFQEIARHERAHDPQPHEPHRLLHLSTLLFGKTYSFEEVIYIVERPREALGPFQHCVVYEGWTALGASMSRFEIKPGLLPNEGGILQDSRFPCSGRWFN
jgi:hypothetical protein